MTKACLHYHSPGLQGQLPELSCVVLVLVTESHWSPAVPGLAGASEVLFTSNDRLELAEVWVEKVLAALDDAA